MATKKEYKEALGRMCKAYYHLDESEQAKKQFKEDLKFLSELVNEHFEEKTETNYEHFEDEIIKNCVWSLALVGGKLHECREKIEEWLKSPYKKPTYKLNKFEYDLLQSYSDIYSFNAFNSLSGMKEKGYFKGIDDNKTIGDILANCEVIK